MKKIRRQLKSFAAIAIVVAGVSSCSAPLPEEGESTASSAAPKKSFSIEEAFKIVAHENDVARKLYTKGVVGPGKKAGIGFDEDWRKDDVEAGPLPALFLRGISSFITKSDVPMGLYLGSDYPVNNANKFVGKQAEIFAEIKSDESPKFFKDEESTLQTAMFPDFAAAAPCVNCHNDHPESPKNDWKLGDVMGATTWTYPADSVTFEELSAMIKAYHDGVVFTFNEFLEEAKAFKTKDVPEIGETWPTDGYFLPTAEEFLDSVKTLSSKATLSAMLK